MKAAIVVKLSFRGPGAGPEEGVRALFSRSKLIAIEKAELKALGV